jgi:LAO/AO transport system kinase
MPAEMAGDPGVFMRSMASRGSLGGIAAATHEVLDLLDAAGFDWLLVETVGVGQSELDVAHATDLTMVVLVPESGDAIQAMKAGLMEIGDLFVVNKADRDGADRSVAEIRAMLQLRKEADRKIPVLRTVAVEHQGVPVLLAECRRLLEAAEASGAQAARRRRIERWRLVQLAQRRLVRALTLNAAGEQLLDDLTDAVMAHRVSPGEAAAELVAGALAAMERERRRADRPAAVWARATPAGRTSPAPKRVPSVETGQQQIVATRPALTRGQVTERVAWHPWGRIPQAPRS